MTDTRAAAQGIMVMLLVLSVMGYAVRKLPHCSIFTKAMCADIPGNILVQGSPRLPIEDADAAVVMREVSVLGMKTVDWGQGGIRSVWGGMR